MSVTEVKQAIDRMSANEWMEILCYMWEKAGVPHVEISGSVEARMKAMDEGNRICWEDVREQVLQREQEAEL